MVLFCAGILGVWAAAVPASQGDPYGPILDPAGFVPDVNNAYFPLIPGTSYIYEGSYAGRPSLKDFYVTSGTRMTGGVVCRLVRDRTYVDGTLQEDTLQWFAQDRAGSVWCFGKAATRLDEAGNLAGTEGSWEAGLGDARPGMVMQAHPRVGDTYHRQYAPGVAEERATVLAVDANALTPLGLFIDCVKTGNSRSLGPGVTDEYFAPGVGFVLSTAAESGEPRLALVDVTTATYTPAPGSIVINEVLAHSHSAADDWIELYNTTGLPIAIGGWFLSDKRSEPTKYQIPDDAVVPARGYLVFSEGEHFGNPLAPGCRQPFALSEAGDAVHLTSGYEGQPTDYHEHESFGPSETGTPFGRYVASDGSAHFVTLSQDTPGAANAYPRIGPVIINEIVSGPPGAAYVELWNISDEEVKLHEAATGLSWRLTDGSDKTGDTLTFDGDSDILLGPGQFLLIVPQRAAFDAAYVVPSEARLLEWSAGTLSHWSGRLALSRAIDIDGVETGWLLVEEVNYDGGHAAGQTPQPQDANGAAYSLSRIDARLFGDDPANWRAAPPSPGLANP
jgi:hypothetical protein